MPKLIHFFKGNIENGVERYVPEKSYYVRGAILDGRFMTKYGKLLVLADDNGFVYHFGSELPKAIAFFVEKKIGWNFGRYEKAPAKALAKDETPAVVENTTGLAGVAIVDEKVVKETADEIVIERTIIPPVPPENVKVEITIPAPATDASPAPSVIEPVTEPSLDVEPLGAGPKKKGKKK